MSILNIFKKDTPAAVGKIGSSECRALYSLLHGTQMSDLDYHDIFVGAGVFPPTPESLKIFGEIFIDHLRDLDIVVKWLGEAEGSLLEKYCPNSEKVALRELEPYYWDDPWSRELKHKTVLVVSPFTDTILSQYSRRAELWERNDILPEFTLKTIKCPFSWYFDAPREGSWETELSSFKQKMERESFDVCLIGAGAWSIPLASHAKRLGKIGIHLGGSLQILFGIKGKRWDDHDVISTFYNDAWVRPSLIETPPNSSRVEGGCYW